MDATNQLQHEKLKWKIWWYLIFSNKSGKFNAEKNICNFYEKEFNAFSLRVRFFFLAFCQSGCIKKNRRFVWASTFNTSTAIMMTTTTTLREHNRRVLRTEVDTARSETGRPLFRLPWLSRGFHSLFLSLFFFFFRYTYIYSSRWLFFFHVVCRRRSCLSSRWLVKPNVYRHFRLWRVHFSYPHQIQT